MMYNTKEDANHALDELRVPRDLLRAARLKYESRIAVITPSDRLTYSDLGDRVFRLASAWRSMGVKKGDHVFSLLKDGREQIEVRLAAYECGAVYTSFPEISPAIFVLGAARYAPPKIFVYDQEKGSSIAEQAAKLIPGIRCVATGNNGYEPIIAGEIPIPSPETVIPADPAAFGFTSGTTSTPKAMVTTQEVHLNSLRMTLANVLFSGADPEIVVSGIPLVAAGSGIVLPTIFAGGTIVIPPSYSTIDILHTIALYKATQTFITPSTLIDILDRPGGLTKSDLGTLRNVIYGTAPMPAAKLEEAVRRFGMMFQQGYGMAEVLPPVSLLSMEDHVRDGHPASRDVLGSVGRVVTGVDVKIVDELGGPQPMGMIGEILIKSPTMFSGYYGQPALTAQTLRDGWLWTGDYGYLDAAGFLHVLDRRMDTIRRNGRLLLPRHIEEAVHDHPSVKEACLVGAETGKIVLCISLRAAYKGNSGDIEREIMKMLGTKVESWQMPDSIRIFDELPRSFQNKVLRRDVRQSLA